jgi:DNA polymerase
MAIDLDAGTRAELEERLRFYRDLGLTDFYRRPVDEALMAKLTAPAVAPQAAPPAPVAAIAPEVAAPVAASSDAPPLDAYGLEHQENNVGEEDDIRTRKPIFEAPATGDLIPAARREAALKALRKEIGDCTRCPLHEGRNKLVFGDGDANARLMFVGEGPGADEDAQGLPFVGRAGQLLNNMITAMGLARDEVYIANVVKCRPPSNRVPAPEEATTCAPFLFRQIDVVRPEVLVALGATAATYLLGQRQPLAGLRGRVHAFRETKLIVTYHPAYLLRDPRQKRAAWEDLQIAMHELGLKLPAKK